jgi:hypothetical protein
VLRRLLSKSKTTLKPQQVVAVNLLQDSERVGDLRTWPGGQPQLRGHTLPRQQLILDPDIPTSLHHLYDVHIINGKQHTKSSSIVKSSSDNMALVPLYHIVSTPTTRQQQTSTVG